MKQYGLLFSAALAVGLLPMGTVSYSTSVYREQTRVQSQSAPFRKSQDFIFSGAERVFEEKNKGAEYVESPRDQQTNGWGDSSNDYYSPLVDNSFGEDDSLPSPRQQKHYASYSQPRTTYKSGSSRDNDFMRQSSVRNSYNIQNTPNRPVDGYNPPTDKYYPLGSPRELSMGKGYYSNYDQDTTSPYKSTAVTNPWSSETRSNGNNRYFNKNEQHQRDNRSSRRPNGSPESSSYALQQDYSSVAGRDGDQYFNAPPSNYPAATYARSDGGWMDNKALRPDHAVSPGYVESASPASNYQSADKWNSFSQLGSNDNMYQEYDNSAPYYQQEQQSVAPFPPSKKDYYPIGRGTGMPSSSYNDNMSAGGSLSNNNRSYRSPIAKTNRPGATPSDKSSGTIYYPLQPEYSAHLDPGRSRYNVKDNSRQYYNSEDEPCYQPRSGYGSNWGDAPSASSRFTYRVPYNSQSDRDGRATRGREKDRDDDDDLSPGWLRWLQNLGRM